MQNEYEKPGTNVEISLLVKLVLTIHE